jgi:hypothetical protein
VATLLLIVQLVVANVGVFLPGARQRQIAVQILVMLALAIGRAVLVGVAEVLKQRSAGMLTSVLRGICSNVSPLSESAQIVRHIPAAA